MAKIDITRAELVWPGKYNENGIPREIPHVRLPFQVIETVNESRATREAQKLPQQSTLFDVYDGKEGDTFELGWRNKLIWGDNLLVMGALLEKFAGKIDLIYIDPPFATGADFSFTTPIGSDEIEKEASLIEEKAYRDTWGRGIDSFITMISDRVVLMRELLSDHGTIYVHMGWDVAHYVKLAMDWAFGRAQFLNQIIWKRQTAHSDAKQGSQHFGRVHDCILVYTKTSSYHWNQLHTPHDEKYLASHYRNTEADTGRRYELDNLIGPGGAAKGNPFYEFLGVKRHWRYSRKRMEELHAQGLIIQPSPGAVPRYKRYLDEMPGLPIQDVWTDINAINSQAKEAVGYPTQKPEELLRRILEISTS